MNLISSQGETMDGYVQVLIALTTWLHQHALGVAQRPRGDGRE